MFAACFLQMHLRLDTSIEQEKLPVQTYISRNLGLGEYLKPLPGRLTAGVRQQGCELYYRDCAGFAVPSLSLLALLCAYCTLSGLCSMWHVLSAVCALSMLQSVMPQGG